ncbi:MAG: hypothetical protein IKO52_00390 [Clostridia bacterium]|nr:hypothetical protein [Clostridia bacterium]
MKEQTTSASRFQRPGQKHSGVKLGRSLQVLLHQLNLELSAGDKSSHTVSLNLEILNSGILLVQLVNDIPQEKGSGDSIPWWGAGQSPAGPSSLQLDIRIRDVKGCVFFRSPL